MYNDPYKKRQHSKHSAYALAIAIIALGITLINSLLLYFIVTK